MGPLGEHAAACIANGAGCLIEVCGLSHACIWRARDIPLVQATASSVASMARAAVQHFGPTSCPVTSKLARTRTDRAEDACHQLLLRWQFRQHQYLVDHAYGMNLRLHMLHVHVCCMAARFRKHSLELDIPIAWIDVGLADGQKFPVLQPTDIVRFMAAHDQIGRLVGNIPFDDIQPTLLEFWRRYSKTCHTHQVFGEDAKVALCRCIPCYLHGDDGRSFKKSGVLLINLQGAIGSGSAPFLVKYMDDAGFRKSAMGLNMGGHSYASRLLYCSMQRKFYAKQPQVFEGLLNNLADQLLALQAGFKYRNQTWHIIILGVKGDLPWLTKAATFERHFLRAQRVQNPKSGQAATGICFLCHAGQSRVPYEDFTDQAAWKHEGCDLPWARTPALLKLLHDPSHPSSFYKLDLFHNFHGGAGKDWVASAMTEALSLMPGASKQAKIDEMSRIMKEWGSHDRRNRPHSGDFCVDRIGLTSYQVCPEASWSKHNDTTIYMRFLEHLLSTLPEHAENEKLSLIYRATSAMNLALKLLYEGGLFLPASVAQQAGVLGRFWLRVYGILAVKYHAEGYLRFPLHTKLHYLDHTFRQLEEHSTKTNFVYNILNESVQMDEDSWLNILLTKCGISPRMHVALQDFVGQQARLSRRISPVTNSFRSLERFLVRARKIWVQKA